MEQYTEVSGDVRPRPQPLLIVLSGPSGVGKDSVLKRMKERGIPFHFVVTATTRPPRPGEQHGVDYYFVSKDEFARMIEEEQLMEWSLVYGDYKGIPKGPIVQALARGQDVIMRIDVQGAAKVRALCPEAVLIFLVAESEEALKERLRQRGTESEESLRLRLAMVREELKHVENFDYIVVNRQGALDETVDTILAIVKAEHHRVRHRAPCRALLAQAKRFPEVNAFPVNIAPLDHPSEPR